MMAQARFPETPFMRPSPLFTLLALACLIGLAMARPAPAEPWAYTPGHDQVVGEIKIEHARRSDTLMDIARWLNMGYREIRLANPQVDLWVPGEGTQVLIPSLFVLPDAPREGIVINRAEKRLYFFHQDPDTGQSLVTTRPIGIGRAGRETPVGVGRITARVDNPAWYPTAGVIADYASRGIELPRVIPPGPDNPLGEHAIVLDLPGYLIHGTNRPDGVGMRVSQGCVRMYPEHIRELIMQVEVGTPVRFVDQSIKLGERGGHLYLEVHPAHDGGVPDESQLAQALERWLATHVQRLDHVVDFGLAEQIRAQANGIPARITRDAGLEGQPR
jgi:L,D-transpeptidase ErfK/SrfK